jgi:putative ABC transport system permease protein
MLKFAIRNLISRPMRSLLSLLGLTVAIVGMVGLFSVAEGLDQMVSETFEIIPGLIAMQPGAPIPLFSRIPSDWGDEIAEVPGVSVVNAEIWQRVNLIDEKMIVSPPRFLFGTEIESRLRLKHDPYQGHMIAGRFLTLQDRGTLNTVISKQIAEEFNTGLGETLQVNGYDLTIVGIYHCGTLLLDVALILDIGQVRAISRFDANSVCGFYIEQTGEVDDDELVERIRSVFRGRKVERWQQPSFGLGGAGNAIVDCLMNLSRKLKSMKSGTSSGSKTDESRNRSSATITGQSTGQEAENLPIEVRSAANWAERFDEFRGDLDIFLTLMTAIGVTVAVFSIVNTMLMSVTERIIEFGILKANGWSRIDVLKLITFESSFLGLGGGLLGSTLGWAATLFINWNWPERINLFASPGLLLFSICFSTGLGIFGGLYPAIWAMRMMPMDAIRRG